MKYLGKKCDDILKVGFCTACGFAACFLDTMAWVDSNSESQPAQTSTLTACNFDHPFFISISICSPIRHIPTTALDLYLVPEDGIDRDVIAADIHRYLGDDAYVDFEAYQVS